MLINAFDLLKLPIGPGPLPVDVAAAYTAAVTDAIAAAQDGDRVYIPGAIRISAPAAGWSVSKSIEIFGDGPGADGAAGTGTILSPAGPEGGDVFVVGTSTAEVSYLRIHDLATIGSPGGATGDGIRFRPGGEQHLPIDKS